MELHNQQVSMAQKDRTNRSVRFQDEVDRIFLEPLRSEEAGKRVA